MSLPEAANRMVDSIDELITNLTVLKAEIMSINKCVNSGILEANSVAQNNNIYHPRDIKSCDRLIKNKIDRFSKICMLANAFQQINNNVFFKQNNIKVGTPKIKYYYPKSYSVTVYYELTDNTSRSHYKKLDVEISLNYLNSVIVVFNNTVTGNNILDDLSTKKYNFGAKKSNIKKFCSKPELMVADIKLAFEILQSS